mgnify:FL=1
MLRVIVTEIILYLISPTYAVLGIPVVLCLWLLTPVNKKKKRKQEYDEYDYWQDNQGF